MMAWLMSLLVAFYFFFQFIQINVLNGITEPLMQVFHWTPAQMGQVSGLFFLPIIFLALPAGILLDRYPIKQVILTTLMISIVGIGLMGSATSSNLFALGRLLTGIAHSFCFLSCMRFATGWMPRQELAAATGWIVSIGVMGGMIAQTPLSWMLTHFSWRQIFFWDAALGLFLWAVFLLWLQEPPRATDADGENISLKTALLAVFKNKATWLASVACCCLNTPLMVIGALWGNLYLTRGQHLTDIQASWACSLLFIGSLIGSPITGWLSDRFQSRKPGLYLTSFAALLLTIPFLSPATLSPLLINMLFFGLGLASSGMVIGYAVVSDANPTAYSGTAFALNTIVMMGGSMLFQNLFGLLVGPLSQPDFLEAMFSITGSFVLSLIVSFWLKETYPRT